MATIDMDARYAVDSYPGVAFYLRGYATCIEPIECEDIDGNVWYEPEEVEDESVVRAVMVGDDRVHEIHVDDLQVIGEYGYCHSCGQIGCAHDGLDREEA